MSYARICATSPLISHYVVSLSLSHANDMVKLLLNLIAGVNAVAPRIIFSVEFGIDHDALSFYFILNVWATICSLSSMNSK